MKRFAKTEFFHLIKTNNNNPSLLEDEYEKFVWYLFAENSVCTNKEAYYNALIYTRVELASLTGVSKKKCGNLLG